MRDIRDAAPERIFLAGHRGMVGQAIHRALQSARAAGRRVEILTEPRDRLDLRDQAAVHAYLAQTRPDRIILAAARVGGIHANATYPADFLQDNLSIQSNVIEGALRARIDRLLFLGSSCIYPRDAAQPMREEALLTGPLEPTNAPYAIAKIAGLKLCEAMNRQHGTDFRAVMPTNLYGPGDNFDTENAHVVPALMRRFHAATEAGDSELAVWGSGRPLREFLHVDDMAAAALFVMDLAPQDLAQVTAPDRLHLNVGTGTEVTIADLAALLARVTGFRGRIRFDADRPDGTPRKLLDVSRLAGLGWRARIGLEEGLRETYRWYLAQEAADVRGLRPERRPERWGRAGRS